MNCLIIENDEKTVSQIKNYLVDGIDISIQTISEIYDSALDKTLDDNLDVLFLNLDTKKINPVEFLLETKNYWGDRLEIVGMSTRKKDAYMAFKYDLFDFILKPISPHAVKKTLLKLKKKSITKCNDRICLRSNKDFRYLKTSEILYLKADNNTTDFHMLDGTVVPGYKTLKKYESILPENFLRIHRSYIINRDYIRRVQFGNQTCTLQTNQTKLPFTKSFIDNINLINSFYSGLPELSN